MARKNTSLSWPRWPGSSIAWASRCSSSREIRRWRRSLPAGTPPEMLKKWGGYTTAIFVLGWATGGLIFGAVGDRIGRARSPGHNHPALRAMHRLVGVFHQHHGFLRLSIYHRTGCRRGLWTGGGLLCRFFAGQGPSPCPGFVPGAVRFRKHHRRHRRGGSWLLDAASIPRRQRLAFPLHFRRAAGAGLRVFPISDEGAGKMGRRRRAQGKIDGVRFGSYASLFGEARWRKPALFGMLLCVAGVVGLWGIGYFSPELVNYVIGKALTARHVPAAQLPGQRLMWVGLTMIVQNFGSFLGMMTFTKFAHDYGRKKVFAIGGDLRLSQHGHRLQISHPALADFCAVAGHGILPTRLVRRFCHLSAGVVSACDCAAPAQASVTMSGVLSLPAAPSPWVFCSRTSGRGTFPPRRKWTPSAMPVAGSV